MNYEAYPFKLNEENTHFKFLSEGKRGLVEKVVAFSLIDDNIYNLALLDFDKVTQDYTDQSVTDNGDMPEVLATVMAIVRDYLDQYPERKIYLVGNTAARTRLYQIAINKVIDQIHDLTILGYHNFEWIVFEPNVSFEGFLIVKINVD